MIKIKELREEKNMQQKDVAKKLNKTIACISSWEKSKTQPSIEDLIELANIFEVSIDYLVGKTDEFGNNYNAISDMEMQFLNCFKKLSLANKFQTLGFMKSLASDKY